MSIYWPISRPKLYAPGPCGQSWVLYACSRFRAAHFSARLHCGTKSDVVHACKIIVLAILKKSPLQRMTSNILRLYAWLKVNYYELIRAWLENPTRCDSGEYCHKCVCEVWRRSVVKWKSLSTNNNTKNKNKNNVRSAGLKMGLLAGRQQSSYT